MKKLFMITVAFVCFTVMPVLAEDMPDLHKHWSYTGQEKALNWSDLDPAYHLCGGGEKQSPVNIEKFMPSDLPALNLSYQSTSLDVLNNGHTVQVNYGAGSTMTVGEKVYNLLQFHFHTPSEHYLNGAPYPMELHLVHQAEDGTLGVLGVMMKVGEHHPVIEGIWQNAPQSGGHKEVKSVEFSATQLLPEDLSYYNYEGSLTTPPCTEGVQWHVLKTPIELSGHQLHAFQALFPVNARPIQPMHGRVVTGAGN